MPNTITRRRLLRDEVNVLRLNLSEATFTAAVAKRAGAGPGAAAPLVQGNWDGTGTPDVVSFPRGANIAGHWYGNFDPYQGDGVCFWTPEQSSADQAEYAYIWYANANYWARYNYINGRFFFYVGGQAVQVVSAVVAGTTYALSWAWDCDNTLDGTNYLRFSLNDAHTFGAAVQPTVSAPDATGVVGSTGTTFASNALIEGLTIYRRPLWDGAYGVDVGNGDEINLIWAAGAGKDPCEITGSWDAVFCLPTNSAVGALVTGAGEAWSMSHASNVLVDGFGDTAYAASGWADEGTPVALPGLEYNGTTTSCVVPDAVPLQDLHAAAMTVEGYLRADGWGEGTYGRMFCKTGGADEGWYFGIGSDGGLVGQIAAATDALSLSGADELSADSKLHHVCMQFDKAGDQKVYLWVDGIPVSSYDLQTVAAGAIDTDVGNDLCHGNAPAGDHTWVGLLGGWSRASNILRYTNGEAFVPNAPDNPPAPDGNTAWQTDYSDGAGNTLTDDSGNGNDGALSNHAWLLTRDLSDLQGEQNYPWGYITGSDAANEGITQTHVGLTPGQSYVARTNFTPSSDGVARMLLRIYDETNAAVIKDFYGPRYVGTHTGGNGSATLIDSGARWMQYIVGARLYNITDGSFTTITAASGDGTTLTGVLGSGTDDDWDTGDVYRIVWPYASGVGGYADHPWVEMCAWELPTIARGAVADCVSISVQVLNASTSGLILFQQLEIYENLVDNPSLETGAGNPWIPDGWTNSGLDAGDTQASSTGGAIIHSGADCVQWNVGASDEGLYANTALAVGDFMMYGAWNYGDGARGQYFNVAGQAALQSRLAPSNVIGTPLAQWVHMSMVWRVTVINPRPQLAAQSAAGGVRYSDDVYALLLAPVTLTVTPASRENSEEKDGLQVGGDDVLSVAVAGRLGRSVGEVPFAARPRHAPANLVKWAEANTAYWLSIYGDTDNFIFVYESAANTILLLSSISGAILYDTWTCTAAWVADQKLAISVCWNERRIELVVDGTIRATIETEVAFGVEFATVYYGSHYNEIRQADMVFLKE